MFKKTLTFCFALVVLTLFGNFDFSQQMDVSKGTELDQAITVFEKTPLHFVENQGQVNKLVEYFVSIPQGAVYFTSHGMTYKFFKPQDSKKSVQVNSIKMNFLGANKRPKITGMEKSGTLMNYFLGDDPQKWVSGAPSFSGIYYQELYPQIDLKVYGQEGRFKQEYLVKTGGSIDDIRLQYQGVEKIQVNEKGQLEIFSPYGVIREDAPFSYQVIDGQRVTVDTKFCLDKDNTIGFLVDEYRKDLDLIIDPILLYSTFLGGKKGDWAYEVFYDKYGNAYVTGDTYSNDFPLTAGAIDKTIDTRGDAFIAKLDAKGENLLFSTLLGGTGWDAGEGIKVDSLGRIYVAGITQARNFPITQKAYDKTFNGGDEDIFVAILAPDGDKLLYSTYVGGNGDDDSNELVIYEANNKETSQADSAAKFAEIIVLGETYSKNFPIKKGAYDTTHNGDDDSVIFSLNAKGKLAWSTYLGGSNEEDSKWIEIDEKKNIYVAGYTESKDFPTSEFAYDKTYNGEEDTFVAKLNPTGSKLLYSTYFGGSGDDRAEGLGLDPDGNIVVAGATKSNNMPTTQNAFSKSYNGGGKDGFVVKFDPMLESLIFSTYFGGRGADDIEEMCLDAAGRIYLSGDGDSINFPITKDAYQKNLRGGEDFFLSLLSADGTELIYSTFIGGSRDDDSSLVAIDSNGNCYVGGYTGSPDFPTTKGVVDKAFGGSMEAWVAKFKFPAAGPTSLSGKVTDSAAGAPIWNAVIKLIGKTVKGVKKKVKTDKQGNFKIDELEPGTYKLIITKAGFKKYLVRKLMVDGPTVHDVGLKKK